MPERPCCDALILASIPLFEFDDHQNPVKPCSGCVVAYRGLRVLLTVHHSTGNQGNWAALDHFDSAQGMRIYRLGPLNFLVRLSGGNVEPVDLALVNVPDDFAPLWQHITPLNGIELELPRSILATSLLDTPATGVRYGFAGIVHVERTDGALYGDSKCENDLTFVMEDDIWYHFALNHPHPGDNEYKGCSGAPVMDAGGNLVALLVGRSLVVPDGIRAVPLARYRAAIDLSLGLDPE